MLYRSKETKLAYLMSRGAKYYPSGGEQSFDGPHYQTFSFDKDGRATSRGCAIAEFEASHSAVVGKPNMYKKTALIQARQCSVEELVKTIVGGKTESVATAQAGDWIATNRTGEEYVIRAQKFAEIYEPVGIREDRTW